MIEIFDPCGVEYSIQRAKMELSAAKAAALLKAKNAHLILAEAHLNAVKNGQSISRTRENYLMPLAQAFPVEAASDFDDLLHAIDAISKN